MIWLVMIDANQTLCIIKYSISFKLFYTCSRCTPPLCKHLKKTKYLLPWPTVQAQWTYASACLALNAENTVLKLMWRAIIPWQSVGKNSFCSLDLGAEKHNIKAVMYACIWLILYCINRYRHFHSLSLWPLYLDIFNCAANKL